MSQLDIVKQQISQLQYQANMDRITVSKACEDLIKFCSENQKEDVLVTGDFKDKENPFKEAAGSAAKLCCC